MPTIVGISRERVKLTYLRIGRSDFHALKTISKLTVSSFRWNLKMILVAKWYLFSSTMVPASSCRNLQVGRLENFSPRKYNTLRERYERLVLEFARKMAVWRYTWQDFSTHKG